MRNCRKYLDDLAKRYGKDPLDPFSWYSMPFQRGHSMFLVHGGIRATVRKAYPEVSFDGWPEGKALLPSLFS